MSTADGAYFTHPRDDVARLVPRAARRIVDVGCASGVLGRGLKRARAGVEVRGVEPNAEAAKEAERWLDDVLVGGAEDEWPKSWPAPDCVVFADVLEHLVDPWNVLRQTKRRIALGGAIVVSIPNVSHWKVRRDLLRGRFEYRDEGLLDRTHLRFFTPRTARALVEDAGFRIEHVERVINEIPETGFRKLDPNTFRTCVRDDPNRHGTLRSVFLDPLTFQVLMVAR